MPTIQFKRIDPGTPPVPPPPTATAWPDRRRLIAAAAGATRDPLTFGGVVLTALLFAGGDAVWPAPQKADLGSRIGHDIGVVGLTLIALLAVSFFGRLGHYQWFNQRRWTAEFRQAHNGWMMAEIHAIVPPPAEIAFGRLEAYVRSPSGEFHVFRRDLGVFAGIVGRPDVMLDIAVPLKPEPGLWEVRWYRPVLGARYGELVRGATNAIGPSESPGDSDPLPPEQPVPST